MKDNANMNSEGFDQPEGYEGSFAGRLRRRMECMEELAPYTRLASLKGDTGFSVPENYFSERMEFTYRLPLPQSNTFEVPVSYFESGVGRLLSLAERGGAQASQGPARPARSGKTKVIFMHRVLPAAIAALLLVTAGFWIFRTETTPPVQDCETIACLEKQDLLRSGTLESFSEEDLMQVIDDDLLEERLEPEKTRSKGDSSQSHTMPDDNA